MTQQIKSKVMKLITFKRYALVQASQIVEKIWKIEVLWKYKFRTKINLWNHSKTIQIIFRSKAADKVIEKVLQSVTVM